jgi:hypothetical protein
MGGGRDSRRSCRFELIFIIIGIYTAQYAIDGDGRAAFHCRDGGDRLCARARTRV